MSEYNAISQPRCGEQYSHALPSERTLLNHGLFKKLFIGEDGSVEHA